MGGNGVGLGGLLFVAFVVLKLTGVIAWSWWWVTAPLWISAAFALVVIGFALAKAAWIGQLKRRR